MWELFNSSSSQTQHCLYFIECFVSYLLQLQKNGIRLQCPQELHDLKDRMDKRARTFVVSWSRNSNSVLQLSAKKICWRSLKRYIILSWTILILLLLNELAKSFIYDSCRNSLKKSAGTRTVAAGWLRNQTLMMSEIMLFYGLYTKHYYCSMWTLENWLNRCRSQLN